MNHDEHGAPAPFRKSRAGITLLVALAVGAFYLLVEHKAHVLGVLPYLLILACPLMHLFMHHGHHHGGESQHPTGSAHDEQRPQ